MDVRHVLVTSVSYDRLKRRGLRPSYGGVRVGPELQSVVDEVSRLLGAPAVLEDRGFGLVAYGRQASTVDPVRQASILQRQSTDEVRTWFESFGIATSRGPVRTPANPALGTTARLCLPVRAGGVTHGYLWLVEQDLRDVDEHLPAAMDLAARAGRLLARGAREQQARQDRLADLCDDDRAVAAQAAQELVDSGLLRSDEPVVVAAVRTTGGVDSEREPVAVRGGALAGSVLSAPLRGHTVLLVPLRDGSGLQAARDAVAAVCDDAPGAVAGIGSPRRDLPTVHESWAEARLAARVAAAVPERAPMAEWASLGAYRLLAAAPEAVLAAALVDEPVRALLDDPDERLAVTAARYLELAGSVKATAAALQVHRQTLYYRLSRIEQVTGLDLSDGEDRLRLHLGLLVGRLVAADAGS